MSYQSEFKKFESRFAKEEKEFIILTSESVGSAGSFGKGMWTPRADFLAYIDTSDNSFVHEEGFVEWLCEDSESGEWRYDLKPLTAYRLKCREETEECRNGANRHFMMLTEVLERNVSDPRLQEVLDAYNTPVELNDELCGKFMLDRQFEWFTREIDWCGEKATIYLECNDDDPENASEALEHFKEIYSDLEEWDKKLREFAAEKLTDLANDWQDDDNDYDDEDEDEEDDDESITEEDFAERICISEFSVDPEGDFTAYYNDDDMFWGHSIEINGNVNGEFEDANICG